MPRELLSDQTIRAPALTPARPPGAGSSSTLGGNVSRSGQVLDVQRVVHAEQLDVMAGLPLHRRHVEHVALGAATPVDELVDMEDAHVAFSPLGHSTHVL